VEAHLQALDHARKQRRLQELRAAFVAGEITPGDARSEELRALEGEVGRRRRYED
jgi:hypothetical protein